MDEVLRGVAFLACVGLFVFGVTRLVKRFRAAESFALRFVIVASSLLWLVFVVPGLAVTFVSPTNQLLAVVTTIAIWPFFALGAARINFRSEEWAGTTGVRRRREARGIKLSSKEELAGNILSFLIAVAILVITAFIFIW